jgi:hypothetical protein
MEELKAKTEQLTSDIGDLLDTYYKLTLIKATEKATSLSTGLFTVIVISLVSLSIFLFIGIGLSVWMGEVLNNTIAGYFVVALFYILLLVLFVKLRRKLVHPIIRDLIVRKINL